MTDIVDRLRDTPNWQRQDFKTWKDGCSVYDRAPFEAADEIERLRGIIEEQRLTIGALNMKLGGATTLENLRRTDQPDDATERTGIEFLHLWMRTPNPMLGSVSPLDMMDSGRGERLADFIRDAADADGITIPALAKSLSETEAALERETALLTEAKRQNADLMAIIDKRDEALGFVPLDKGMDMQDELRETKARLTEEVENAATYKQERDEIVVNYQAIEARLAHEERCRLLIEGELALALDQYAQSQARLAEPVNIVRDLTRQITEFTEREGEADFYTGVAVEFLKKQAPCNHVWAKRLRGRDTCAVCGVARATLPTDGAA